jgi:hypothetical protein
VLVLVVMLVVMQLHTFNQHICKSCSSWHSALNRRSSSNTSSSNS